MRGHTRDRDRKAIEYHYDVSNEFNSLFLDENMVYSCAYYRSDLAGCAYGFANGWMNVYQVLGSHAKNVAGDPLPFTRDYMYVS